MARRVAFEQHDDEGRAFRLVYTVPGDAPADLTEAQAEALDPNPPVCLDGSDPAPEGRK